MTEQIHVSVGLDLHKKFILATLLSDTGLKKQLRFERMCHRLSQNSVVQPLFCSHGSPKSDSCHIALTHITIAPNPLSGQAILQKQ